LGSSVSGFNSKANSTLSYSALAFLDKSLFTSYHYNGGNDATQASQSADRAEDDRDDENSTTFQIALPAMLETLQIFANDASSTYSKGSGLNESGYPNYRRASTLGPGGSTAGSTNPLDTRFLGMTGMCKLSYAHEGAPFCLTLSEGQVTTTCSLSTFAPEDLDEIPLERDKLSTKIILRSSRLHDAIMELESTNPSRLTITASPKAPFFLISSAGPLGSTSIEFSRDPGLLETFEVGHKTSNTYRYALIKLATRAMAMASKVSVRCDWQGVLSLQFMIEIEGGEVSFVDFRFVPLIEEEWDVDHEDADDDYVEDE
jgi:cell cycle checkpoint protein